MSKRVDNKLSTALSSFKSYVSLKFRASFEKIYNSVQEDKAN